MNSFDRFINKELKKLAPKKLSINDYLEKITLTHFILGDNKVLGKCNFSFLSYMLSPNRKTTEKLLNKYMEKRKALFKGCSIVVLGKGLYLENPPKWKNKDGFLTPVGIYYHNKFNVKAPRGYKSYLLSKIKTHILRS